MALHFGEIAPPTTPPDAPRAAACAVLRAAPASDCSPVPEPPSGSQEATPARRRRHTTAGVALKEDEQIVGWGDEERAATPSPAVRAARTVAARAARRGAGADGGAGARFRPSARRPQSACDESPADLCVATAGGAGKPWAKTDGWFGATQPSAEADAADAGGGGC